MVLGAIHPWFAWAEGLRELILLLGNGTFTSEFLDVRVCWTVLYPQGEYVGLSYILKALFTNNRGGCKTVQHCLTYSNIILTSKNSDVNVP